MSKHTTDPKTDPEALELFARRVLATLEEYGLGREPRTDADGFEVRTPLGDGLARDAGRTIAAIARRGGLIQ